MNRPKHNRWLLTLFLVCAIILSLPRPKANAQNFVNNRFNVVVVLDATLIRADLCFIGALLS